MDVRVGQIGDQLTGLALATGLAFPPSPCAVSGVLAQRCLGEPQGEALLSHPPRAFEEERLWQPAGGDSAYQPVADPLMAVQGGDGHGGNVDRVWNPEEMSLERRCSGVI